MASVPKNQLLIQNGGKKLISNNQQTSPVFPSSAAVPNTVVGSTVPAPGLPLTSTSSGVQPGNSTAGRSDNTKNFQQHMQDASDGREDRETNLASSAPKTGQQKDRTPSSKSSTVSGDQRADSESVSNGASKTRSGKAATRETKESKPGDSESGQKTVIAQILRQIIKQNPQTKPEALSFLQGQITDDSLAQLPLLMTNSRFVADALIEGDMDAFMAEDAKPSAVLKELGFTPDTITQALALGLDNSGSVSRGAVLAALGAQPAKVTSLIEKVKASLTRDGVTGYMQQALALAKASGKRPDLVESLSTVEFDEAASHLSDFKHQAGLEAQTARAQALSASGSWAPLHAASGKTPQFDAPASAISGMTGIAFASSSEPSSLKILEFANRLEFEFSGDVRILDVGQSAWDQALEQSISGSDLTVDATQNGMSDMNTTVDGVGLSPEIQSAKIHGPFDGSSSDLTGVVSLSLKSSSEDLLGDFFESRAKQEDLSTSSNVSEASKVVVPPTVTTADVHSANGSDVSVDAKAERIESNTRHAVETVRKIQDAVRRTAVSDIGAMRLDLSSPETGNLEVAVRVDKDQQVDVRVMAASGELRDLLAKELPQLKSSLGEQNLNLRDLDVRAWTGGQGDSAGQFGGQNRQDAWQNEYNDQLRQAAGRIASGLAGISSPRGAATSSIAAINGQLGRQALRSFKILDMTDRQPGDLVTPGRIKVLA
jgi:hypothetical protein